MKKLLLLVSAALFVGTNALAQGVYQIPNSDFNAEWTSDKEPGNGWNSFASATGDMADSGKRLSPNPSREDGRSGAGKCVKIFSKFAGFLGVGANANGNLTTGMVNMGSMTPTDASNHNYTKCDDPAHSLLFAGHPDAVEFYAMFTSGGSPHGRGQFILHGNVNYKDPEDAAQRSERVAIASVVVPPCDTWTCFSGEFTYDARESAPEKQYMLASFTTNPTPGGSKDDYLWIDDVKLIYYHALSALSYGEAALNFNEATTSYDLSSELYDPSKLSYTKKGQGAKVTTSYDEATAVLTIRVEGDDFSENPESVTTYTIRFGKPLNSVLTSAQFNGESITPVEDEVVKVAHIYKEDAFTATCEADPAATIKKEYDAATGVLTVTVTGSDVAENPANVHTYKFQFNLPLNSVLTSAQFNGESITPVEDEVVKVAHIYKEDAFTATCEADPAADIKKEYDAETGVLTVTVTGSDAAENPANVHTYKFQFNLPLNSVLSGVKFNEETVTPVEDEVVTVAHIYKEDAFTATCEADPAADIKKEYDAATGLLTVTVTGSDVAENPANVHTYKFQFNLPLSSVLTSVVYDGQTYKIEGNAPVVIDHLYEAGKFSVSCEADPAADIKQEYDETTGQLTVTVTGSDVAENPENVHTYKFQFNLPFNSEISLVTYGGEEITLNKEGVTVVDHIYKEGQLEVVCAGDKEAKVEESYDAETGVLTVTVTGSDAAENPANVHTYKFQFNLPLNSVLSGVTYNGKDIEFSETETTTIEGSYDEKAFAAECEADAEATIEYAYDAETDVLTVTVTGSDVAENPTNVHTYKFQFTVPVGISSLFANSACDVYTLSGKLVRKNATTLAGLPKGIYVVNGKKIIR